MHFDQNVKILRLQKSLQINTGCKKHPIVITEIYYMWLFFLPRKF